jgi:hypothetical protein
LHREGRHTVGGGNSIERLIRKYENDSFWLDRARNPDKVKVI